MNKQSGFTLIELLLVLAIIGIISAIAVPALLGQRERAKGSATKDNTVSILADCVSTLEVVTDPVSERPSGYAVTVWDTGTQAGLRAVAAEVVKQVMLKSAFANAKNPYSGAIPCYTASVLGATPGQVYLDASAATIADPVILVTGVYKDNNGTTQPLVKRVPLN